MFSIYWSIADSSALALCNSRFTVSDSGKRRKACVVHSIYVGAVVGVLTENIPDGTKPICVFADENLT